MTHGVTVRLARDDELDAAGDLVVAAYRTHRDMEDGDGYLAHVRDARGRATEVDVLVAVDADGRMLGCVSHVRDHTSAFAEVERPGEAGFRMLGVDPEARGQGVGQALVEACIERARASGRTGLVIVTAPSWTDAQRLYERIGFRRAPDRGFEPVPGITLWAYELKL
jgi:ribosomal protein S18 acetylase RimI-like enzyme